MDKAQTHTSVKICFLPRQWQVPKALKMFKHHHQRTDDTLLQIDLHYLEMHVTCRAPGKQIPTHTGIASCVYAPSSTPVLLYPHFKFPARLRQKENKQQSAAPVMQVPSHCSTGTPHYYNHSAIQNQKAVR